jgi:hypothetical protein
MHIPPYTGIDDEGVFCGLDDGLILFPDHCTGFQEKVRL